MARERICQYGNCHNTDIRVTVNIIGSERPAFCCEAHAGLYLLRHAVRISPDREEADKMLSALREELA